ncbi:MAG: TGS domain-containing protein [Pyrinomonadaceae bacterium]
MSEINVKFKDHIAALVAPATVAEALKRLDRDLAKQALAAKVDGREVDLAYQLETQANGGGDTIHIEPVLPQTLDGLGLLRHSTAHLLAAAVLDLFPGTQLGIGPALLEDPRYGFFYDVITPRPLTDADLAPLEKRMREIAKRNLAYRREEIDKAEALRIFDERAEPLKRELITAKGGDRVSVYYIDGTPFVDFALAHTFLTPTACAPLSCFRLQALTGWVIRNARRCSGSTAPPFSIKRIWTRGLNSAKKLSAAITGV